MPAAFSGFAEKTNVRPPALFAFPLHTDLMFEAKSPRDLAASADDLYTTPVSTHMTGLKHQEIDAANISDLLRDSSILAFTSGFANIAFMAADLRSFVSGSALVALAFSIDSAEFFLPRLDARNRSAASADNFLPVSALRIFSIASWDFLRPIAAALCFALVSSVWRYPDIPSPPSVILMICSPMSRNSQIKNFSCSKASSSVGQ